MREFTDEQYLSLINKSGNTEFGLMSDKDLEKYNPKKEIDKIKIERVKSTIKWYKTGIELYEQLLNNSN